MIKKDGDKVSGVLKKNLHRERKNSEKKKEKSFR
jgi:hypothetical protein